LRSIADLTGGLARTTGQARSAEIARARIDPALSANLIATDSSGAVTRAKTKLHGGIVSKFSAVIKTTQIERATRLRDGADLIAAGTGQLPHARGINAATGSASTAATLVRTIQRETLLDSRVGYVTEATDLSAGATATTRDTLKLSEAAIVASAAVRSVGLRIDAGLPA